MITIDSLENDIKNLKIQGATNIALKVLEGLEIAYDQLKKNKNLIPRIYLMEQCLRLAFIRPTEPLAQNAVRYIFQKKDSSQEIYLKLAAEFKKMISEAKFKMGQFGADLIKNGGVYLTHCHSSTVTNMFIAAKKQGKNFRVFVTETRPMYQGRITVKELLEAQLNNVTMVIDDVASSLLLENKIKFNGIFIGADLLSQNGFINKVGSLGVAYCAKENKIPVFAMSILLKYDPRIYSDNLIEERQSSEIWPDAPEKLKFYSPAFDYIPYFDNISLITETGLLNGNQIQAKAIASYPFLTNQINRK